MTQSCFVLVGEQSGQEHIMSFLPTLIKHNPQWHFYGVGGDDMQALGVELLYHLNEFSSWGIVEVFQKLPFYYKALKHIQQEVKKRSTKVAILVDFQEANFYLARKLKQLNVKVLYYVAPQAWGWRANRCIGLKENTYRLYTILPFEKKWFKDRGVLQTQSVAHPLTRTLSNLIVTRPKSSPTHWNILLLPGSRNAEVIYLLPIFLDAIKLTQLSSVKKIHVSIVIGPSVRKGIFDHYARTHPVFQKATLYKAIDLKTALTNADFCLAASGTVTLEASIFQVPTIVCYKAHLFTAFIFYSFIKYKSYITITNLILEKPILPEFLQDEVSDYNLSSLLLYWMNHPEMVDEIQQNLSRVFSLLQGDTATPIESMDEVFQSI